MSEQINGLIIISENTTPATVAAPSSSEHANTKDASQCSTSAQDVLHEIQKVTASIPEHAQVNMPDGYCITSPVKPLNGCTLPSSAQQSILCPPSTHSTQSTGTPTTHSTDVHAKDGDTIACTFSAHHEEVIFTSGRTYVSDLFVLTGNYKDDGSYDYDMVIATSSRMPEKVALTTATTHADAIPQHADAIPQHADAIPQHTEISPII